MSVRIIIGDCREAIRTLPSESVHCVVTSPPYWGLRDYGTGTSGIGLEETLDEHMDALTGLFRDVRRVLRAHGSYHRHGRQKGESAPDDYVPPNGANKRSVWTVPTQAYAEAHFATFPPALIEPCIKAGCPEGGTVLDPFGGAGTTGLVADRLRRNAVLIELNQEYAAMAARRIDGEAGMLSDVRTETLNPNPEALPA